MSYHQPHLPPADAARLRHVLSGFAAQSVQGLGALERANPLPVGRYWQDIFEVNKEKFRRYLAANMSSIHVEVTQSTGDDGEPDSRDFYIFNVLQPVAWDAKTFGYPTIAPKEIKSSDDTVSKPSTTSFFQFVDSIFGIDGDTTLNRAGAAVQQVAFWALVAVGGVLVYKTADTLGIFKRKSTA